MKCNCDECKGNGYVTCPECCGHGWTDTSIEHAEIDSKDPHYSELLELKTDAKRCIQQANILREMRPDRAGRYDEQLAACLREINRQADEVIKTKTT